MIFESAEGTVSLGRRNPSQKSPSSIAKSDFLNFCVTVNNFLPRKTQRHFNGGASHGLSRAVRRALAKVKPIK